MPIATFRRQPIALAVSLALGAPAFAQQTSEQTLAPVVVREAPSPAERIATPATTESVTRERIADTVNVVNTEDAFRYLPNILVRKRHIGDTQAPITTRTSGVGASARSLIFADGMLLTPLIANDNNNGGPRYGMVSPEEIERIDVMYGPFSAAYAGNSIGAVAEITTRMPKGFEASAGIVQNWQRFSQYGTTDTYASQQINALIGNKVGDFSFWISGHHLDSHSQPLTYATVTRTPGAAGTRVSGAIPDANRNGAAIFVLGDTGIEHHLQDNAKVKLAYEFSPTLRLTYTGGLFSNNTTGTIRSYLTNAAGAPVFAGTVNQGGFTSAAIANSVFDSGIYRFREEHTMHGVSLKSDTRGSWDWELSGMRYEYGKSERRSPTGALPAALSGGAGTIVDMKGTGWGSLDFKGFWRPAGAQGAHVVSFGAHWDRAVLDQPTWNAAEWTTGSPTTLASDSRGKTETAALWVQDVWKFAPDWKATAGLRLERWTAFDGRNYSIVNNAPSNAVQPGLGATATSPKLSVARDLGGDWLATVSVGKASRFPTVIELYRQAQAINGQNFLPNPNLRPEAAWSSEFAIEKAHAKGRVRVSVFTESIRDALISQSVNQVIGGTLATTSFVQNIDRTRSTGIELVAQQNDVFIKGLELTGSVTHVDARVVKDDAYPVAVGKYVPQVPNWRATLVATYRPNERTAATVALRHQGRMFGSIENWDGYAHTYQGFEGFTVVDVRIRHKLDRHWTAALGIDNLNNHNYFLFHPFPQRSLTAELKYSY